MVKRTLYFGNPAYLSLKLGQLVITLPASKEGIADTAKPVPTKTIPIEDIGVVVLDNKQITITSGVLEALLENNVAVITCDNKGLPVGLLLPLCGNTVQNERFRYQLDASLPLKKQLWQQTIEAKVRNQAAVLKHVHGEEAKNMLKWSTIVKSGDTDNIEARAAAFYWKNVFCNHPEFIRDQFGEYPNNLLNYGYAILRAMVARALVCVGLLPTLGIHHHNRYNAYCLADDIMEPYRPYVDRFVLGMMESMEPENDLRKETKAKLLGIPVIDVSINGVRSPLMVAVMTTANSLCKCFRNECRKIIYPDM